MSDLLKYKLDYRMRTNDFDCYDTIMPSSILNSCQDIAGVHADYLNVGYSDMLSKGYYWVILRQGFKVYKEITPGSKIIVETFPREKNKFQFIRDYRILDEVGETLVEGSSLWVVIDINTRSVSRATDINYVGTYETNLCDITLTKLKFDDNFENNYTHKVTYSDLDHNKHYNNSRYLDICMNILKLSNKNVVKEFYTDYLHEAILDDILNINYQIEGNIAYFNFVKDNKVITKIKLIFEGEL